MQALNNRVIVKKAKMPEKTKSGIYIADSTKKDGLVKLNIGKVVSFGPGCKTETGEWLSGYEGKVGDWVAWEQFGEFSAEVLGEGIWVLRNEDLTVRLDPEEYKVYELNENDSQQVETEKPEITEAETFKKTVTVGCNKCDNYWVETAGESLGQCNKCKSWDVYHKIEAPGVVTNLTPKFH